jgi:hypothetical protein
MSEMSSSGEKPPPEALEFVEASSPDLLGQYEMADQPGLSKSPDELEIWESEQIENRKQREDYEDVTAYGRRLFYEEAFSVNQSPGVANPPKHTGMPGMTPGGLVSHFYSPIRHNGVDIEQLIAEVPDQGNSLSETVQLIDDRELARILISFCHDFSTTEPWASQVNAFRAEQIFRGGHVNPILEGVGFRMIKMFAAEHSMLEQADGDLISHLWDGDLKRLVSRAELLAIAWKQISPVLLPEGYYTHENNQEIRMADQKLIMLRSHPDMQIFFKYLSPSGYVNDATDSQGSK